MKPGYKIDFHSTTMYYMLCCTSRRIIYFTAPHTRSNDKTGTSTYSATRSKTARPPPTKRYKTKELRTGRISKQRQGGAELRDISHALRTQVS